MQMVTTCANCRQQLAVTAGDLRVGQGYVRCGRCDKVFNALLTLAEEAPAPEEPEEAEAVAHGTTTVPALDLANLPPDVGSVVPFGPGDDEVVVVATHQTGRFQNVVLEGERAQAELQDTGSSEFAASADDLARAEQSIAAELADELAREDEVARNDEIALEAVRESMTGHGEAQAGELPDSRAAGSLTDAEIAGELGDSPAVGRQRDVGAPAETSASLPEEFDAAALLGNRPRTHRGWYVVATVLALGLAAQLAHHNRQALVAMPALERPVRWTYGHFGVPVDPVWDLGQYEVIALGSMEQGADVRSVVLRAAVAVNRDAPRAQPPPLLRAELSDRFGNVVARTDVAPRDWLRGAVPARLEPGERRDAELLIPAPGRATSFALSACLPDQKGAVHCPRHLR